MIVGIADHRHLGDSICTSSVIGPLSIMWPRHTFGIVRLRHTHIDVYRDNGVKILNDRSCDFEIAAKDTSKKKLTLCDTLLDYISCQCVTRLGKPTVSGLFGNTPAIKLSEDEIMRNSHLGNYVVIAVASQLRGPHKNYPYIQEIIDSRPDINFVAVGHSYDGIKPLRGVIDMIGDTTVRQSLSILAGAKCLISYSGALVHASATFGVPCICILGCSDRYWLTDYPNVTHVLGECPLGYTIHNNCNKRLCPINYTDDLGLKYPKCTESISPYIIADMLDDYIKN